MPGSPGTTQPVGAVGNCVDCSPGTMVSILPCVSYHGMLDFPAQAEIQREVRLHFPGVLNVGAAVTRAGVQELHAALVIAVARRGSAEQIVGEIDAGNGAIKGEVAVGCANIAFVDLQIAELAPELQRVFALQLSKTRR